MTTFSNTDQRRTNTINIQCTQALTSKNKNVFTKSFQNFPTVKVSERVSDLYLNIKISNGKEFKQ